MSKDKKLVGASAKIEAARQLKESGFFDRERRRNSGGRDFGGQTYPSQTIPVTIIFGLGVIIALLISWNDTNPLAGLHITGIPLFDDFVTSDKPYGFMADPDYNKIITLFIRGAIFFVLAGIIPAIAFFFERTLFHKKVPPLLLCWAATLIVFGVYLFVPLNSLIPASLLKH